MNQVLTEKNVRADIIDIVTTSLIETSVRGVDSHGINLFPHYYTEISLGRLNIEPQLSFDQKASSVAVLDAKNTLGHYAGHLAMKKAIEVAQSHGIGAVSVKDSTHFGAAWYFTDMAANEGMIGFAFTNTEALVNAYNSKEAFFGTNPFCFSAPLVNEEPFCLDMATSTVPWNKIKNYKRQNKALEHGWAYDEQGNLTVDPHKAVSLSNIGDYKGFGLSMVIEILCSGLTGGPLSKDIIPLYDLDKKEERKISHFFVAIDVSKFLPLDLFKSYMSNMAARIRTLPKAGEDDVMIANDKEKQTKAMRLIEGIPVDEDKFNEFLKISENFKSAVI